MRSFIGGAVIAVLGAGLAYGQAQPPPIKIGFTGRRPTTR